MMKAMLIVSAFFLLLFSGCHEGGDQAAAPVNKAKASRAAITVKPTVTRPLDELSSLLKKSSLPGTLKDAEKGRLVELMHLILPDANHIGADREWKVTYHDLPDSDFFQVDLRKKGDRSFDSFMWFHILYLSKKPEFYGCEDFEGYSGMGMENVHYFILVGRTEIRAVASSDEFKNDKKIKDMLRAFKLKDIEQL